MLVTKPAPNFKTQAVMPDNTIQEVSLADYKGKIVSVIKISKSIKDKLDFNKIINRFYQMEGCKYGYQNLLFGWIDHHKKNFPYGLSMELINGLLPHIEYYLPDMISVVFMETFNHRLGYHKLDRYGNYIIDQNNKLNNTLEVFQELYKRQMNFTDLMIMDEQDDWFYNTGPNNTYSNSYVCNVFVGELLKTGGLDLLNITEMTPKDLYSLDIFEKNLDIYKQLGCKDNDLNLQNHNFCQLFGNYRMDSF